VTIVSTVIHIFDLFCGTGGFSYGFQSSEPEFFRTALGIDILEDSLKTFERNHTEAKGIRGDIRRLNCEDIECLTGVKRGELGVLVGGPPCQGFSSIRPFRGSGNDDPRNTLFEQFANILNFFRPPVFVMENVVGLATHNSGETIERIQECFSSCGYSCDWRILNAAHYGVPQKRERLILIGAESGIKIHFPSHTHLSNGATIGHKNRNRMHTPFELPLFSRNEVLPHSVTVMDAIDDLPDIQSGESATRYDKPARTDYQREMRARSKLLSLHSSTLHSPKMLEIINHSGRNISSIPKHLITSGFSSSYSRLSGDEPSVTITVNFVHPASNRCIHPRANRALTPREGARLQSFPDDFEFFGNRSQIVKQIGNAVPPLLGKAIGMAVSQMLGIRIMAQQADAPNSHAFGTFVTEAACAPSAPKASGSR